MAEARPLAEYSLGSDFSSKIFELQQGEGETLFDFFGRAAAIASEYPDYVLKPNDIIVLDSHLPAWSGIRYSDKGGRHRFSARRDDTQHLTMNGGYNRAGHRIVGRTEQSAIFIAIAGNMTGDDAETMFRIEQDVERARRLDTDQRGQAKTLT